MSNPSVHIVTLAALLGKWAETGSHYDLELGAVLSHKHTPLLSRGLSLSRAGIVACVTIPSCAKFSAFTKQ